MQVRGRIGQLPSVKGANATAKVVPSRGEHVAVRMAPAGLRGACIDLL